MDAASSVDPFSLAGAVLRAGVRLLQYRAKTGVDPGVVRRLVGMTRAHGALLVVNDDLEAAMLADGLHAGPEDLVRLGSGLRRRLGDRILGLSCGTPAEVPAALDEGADYIGAGPFAPTPTKGDAGAPIGRDGVAAVVRAAGGVPVAAIGGIRAEDLATVAGTGAAMAAVVSAVASAPDPEAAARGLVATWAALAR